MKRLFLLALVAGLALAGCQREEGEVVFEASLAHNNAKISMDASNLLAWEEGDLVRLGYFGHSTVFEVAVDNREQIAHLHQKLEWDASHTYRYSTEFYALYPGSNNTGINNTITTNETINKYYKVTSTGSVQIVTDDRHYDKNWLVCTAAKKENSSDIPASGTRTVQLLFHNCMALLKCTIAEGCTNIYQLKVTAGNNGAYIGGHAWVSACDAGVDLENNLRENNNISSEDKKRSITLKKQDNTALMPGEYYIAIWSDYYNATNVTSTPSMSISDYAHCTTKENVTITPCNASGTAISSYGSYTVESYSFFRNTIYPVGTFPKTSKESKEASIFH